VKFVLAPLAGFTDAAFRRLCRKHGADATYTEMVSAAGLAHGSSPTRHLTELLPDEGPIVCQVFGANPDDLAFAAREISALKKEDGSPRFTALDLNAGCPMTKIVREGAGSALLKNPDAVHRCLAAMKAASTLPITLKTRPGPAPDRVLLKELIDAAEKAGASGFTLHARFTSQMHGGGVHLDLLAEAVSTARIPVTGNGGIRTRADAEAMAATGVDAIMIGRAALANPFVFNILKGLRNEAEPTERFTAFREHIASILELRDVLLRDFPNDHVPSADGMVNVALHTHLFRYFSGLPGAAEMRRRLGSIKTLAETEALVAAAEKGILA